MQAVEPLSKTEVARGYDDIVGKLQMSPKFYRLCFRLLSPRIRAGARVIDLGCGQGGLLEEFAKGLPGVQFFALDISNKLAEFTQKRVSSARVLQGDVEHLPFKNGQFDAVLMTEVFEHLPSPAIALAQVFRILKPGGWLMLSIPNRDWFRHEEYETQRRRYQPVDDHWYSVGEVRQLIKNAGFGIQLIRGAENLYFGGGLPRLGEKVALLVYPKLHERMKRAIFLMRKPEAA